MLCVREQLQRKILSNAIQRVFQSRGEKAITHIHQARGRERERERERERKDGNKFMLRLFVRVCLCMWGVLQRRGKERGGG